MSELSIRASFDQPVIHARFDQPTLNAEFPVGNSVFNITNNNTYNSSVVAYVSTEPIAEFDPVISDGQIADSEIISHRGKFIGLATESVGSAIGSTAAIGEITNPAWMWTPGALIFLNGTILSATPPDAGSSAYSLLIGTATSPDTIDVSINQAYQF